MFSQKIIRLTYKFCKITPQIYQNLYKTYSTKPNIQTFGKYYNSDNLIQIYNIIKYTKMKIPTKINALNQISQKLCIKHTDMQFNILANIHKDKCMLYLQEGQNTEAIVQIQKAIQAIQGMQQPFSIQYAVILQTAANIHIKIKDYKKAQKYLKDAQHLLNITQQQILQSNEIPKQIKQKQLKQINLMMAKIFSQFCLVHMQLSHVFQARQYLTKSLEKWKNIENKNIMTYLLTIKFKCIIHAWVKEQMQAIQTAKKYLQQYQATPETDTHRMWFMKFLIDKGIDTYAEELKAKITELSKLMSEKQLADFLTKIGVIKKPKPNKTKKANTQQNKQQNKEQHKEQHQGQTKQQQKQKSDK